MSIKKITLTFLFAFLFQLNSNAQQKSPFTWNENVSNENIYMIWNKNTPETEMKDDIKALAEKGVTIKYSNIKRNSNNEITAIKVEYSDRKGNKGAMELDNQKPINTIKFYKENDNVGFGDPSNTINMMNGGNFFENFSNGNPNDLIKQFQFNFDDDSLSTGKFNFQFPNGEKFGQSSSKIIIKKDGKKPLVIENGKVIEGSEDYTPEEIEEIQKDNKSDFFNDKEGYKFHFKSDDSDDNDLNATKEEMLKAKEEMKKATEEMKKAKEELEKAKTSLKLKKA
jgi:hypothetical protein